MSQTFREFVHGLSTDEREVMSTFRPLAHKRIVLTGKLADAMLREEASKWLYAWGAVIESEVHPATDVLLAVDPDRMTVKCRDARRLGVAIKDEPTFTDWLRTMLAMAEDERSRLEGMAPPPPETFFGEPTRLPVPPEFEDFVDTITPLSDFGA